MLQSISFQDFRCLDSSNWSPGGGRHVLVGRNGVGKTSVLEVIYFLATTKSFRTGQLADCLRWTGREFWVRGRLEGERGAELMTSWRRGRTVRQVNGKNSALKEYLGLLAALSWSASDDRLLDGDPTSRRRLLDQGVVARRPLEVEVLTGYRRILTAKRRLLATAGSAAAESLDSWNELMAVAGHKLLRLRFDYLAALREAFRETVDDAGIELRPVEFDYRPSPPPGVESVDDFRSALEAVRARELAQKRSLVGPHLDRLQISWGGSDIGRSASAGERKLFGLTLTAARRRVLVAEGREPIILLDDLDAGLDPHRLESAWRLLEGVPQVFMTSAHSDTGRRVDSVENWRLEGGRIDPF